MIEPTARCARHPEASATFTCPRCGTFICSDCERRAGFDTAPLCPACWASRPPATSEGTGLQTAGLVLGVVSLFPCCLTTVVSLVVNVIALVKARQAPASEVRWKPILGLVLTLFGLLEFLFLAFFQIFNTPTH